MSGTYQRKLQQVKYHYNRLKSRRRITSDKMANLKKKHPSYYHAIKNSRMQEGYTDVSTLKSVGGKKKVKMVIGREANYQYKHKQL